MDNIETLAREVAKVCWDNGILLCGCGCCGTLTYKGIDFDRFIIQEDGTVTVGAFVKTTTESTRREFTFNVKG
jgi:hypothetical protein